MKKLVLAIMMLRLVFMCLYSMRLLNVLLTWTLRLTQGTNMRILLALLLILLPINSYAFTAGNTLTRTSNIINVNASNIGGSSTASQDIFMVDKTKRKNNLSLGVRYWDEPLTTQKTNLEKRKCLEKIGGQLIGEKLQITWTVVNNPFWVSYLLHLCSTHMGVMPQGYLKLFFKWNQD